jgi:DNA topoisomerase-1
MNKFNYSKFDKWKYSDFSGGRDIAFDDENKQKKRGIYRVSYLDQNDLDKKGNPKLKFNYFYYKNDKGVSLEELERINKLGLAPAYKDVWVSEDPTSKIQATGIDAKGRKQYRYHQEHIKNAEEDKFVRLYSFIKSISKFENKIEEDTKQTLFMKGRTIALMFNIIKEFNIRVGKEIYAQTNKSYGMTSLKKSHATVSDDGTVIKLNFKAKSNKHVSYTIKDKYIVDEIKNLLNLEGEKLFQYINGDDNTMRVTDVDLNEYIQTNMGKQFTVKDYRTYGSNVNFLKALLNETKKRNPKNKKVIKQNLSLAQESTAKVLRHTKAISKKSYTVGLIREMYENQPEWFVENRNKKPITVLIEILKIYKEKIKNKK